MRNARLNLLLAGTTLTLATVTAFEAAAQSAVRQIPPPAPTFQGQTHRNIVQMPPPPARSVMQRPQSTTAPRDRAEKSYARETQENEAAPRHNDAPIATAPIAPAPAPAVVAAPAPQPAQPQPEPAQAETKSGGGLMERLFGANDSQIGERLRASVSSKQWDKRLSRPAERTAVEQIYAAKNYAPLWIKDGRVTSRGDAAVTRLKNAAADGLDAADYAIPDFSAVSTADAIADADVKLTYALITYARTLSVGRIAPRRVVAEVDYGDHTPDVNDIAKRIADASDIDAALESYNPQDASFKALKAKLAELRASAASGVTEDRLPDGPALRVGMKDPRIPQIRHRLGMGGKADDTLFDKRLSAAVKNIQSREGLQTTGILDNKVIAALNGPRLAQKIDTVAANMERWRWLPRDLGKLYVMVNIPDYTLKVVRNNDVVWRSKIVAGKPQTQTPLTSGSMHMVTVNPSWYVPQSIIQNELLPQYASDPQIFERLGLEVQRGPDGHINVVQPPGAANALGRIKFSFYNKFQVYLHDTPEKRLFSAPRRAYSHGCMRVEDPTKFGEIILSLAMNTPGPTSQQINQMFGQEQKEYKLVTRPTVILTYQTAFVDDSGKLVLRDDIYGHDKRIHTILNSDERKIADVAPPAADPKADLEAMKTNQQKLNMVERRETGNPFKFFDRLFR